MCDGNIMLWCNTKHERTFGAIPPIFGELYMCKPSYAKNNESAQAYKL
jgi:hypothetical protein